MTAGVPESIAGRVRPRVTSLFGRLGTAVPGRAAVERLLERDDAAMAPPPLPDGAAAVLRPDAPRLVELAERYRGHPATAGSLWSEGFVRRAVDLRRFRADNAYVWQRRNHACAAAYALTTLYVERHDRLGLLDRLDEDGLFGATVHDVDGRRVSRDLLDSVLELTFLDDATGMLGRPGLTFLDIGAGYGRLAHRVAAATGGITWLSTDAVPVSTFVCEYYVRFRSLPPGHAGPAGPAGQAAQGGAVIPLDEVAAALAATPLRAAVNVHSFEECPVATTGWWLDRLAEHEVRTLMLVANGEELVSRERSGARLRLQPEIERRGWTLSERRPKYAHSASVQRVGLFPAQYYLFERP